MPSSVSLKAIGLNYSPNQLSLPDGSLIVAKDVIIRRDNVVESRRGNREYSEQILPKQLIEYKERILCHNENVLSFDTGTLNAQQKAIFNEFSGNYLETEPGLRIKSIEANKNLYFTSLEGIKKIAARTASDFTTDPNFIVDAGAIRAVDLTAELTVEQGELSGFLPNDSTVAYRVVFGYKDINNNLNLGYPSNRTVVYNYLEDVIAMDLNTLLTRLDAIDQGLCLITDGNYATNLSVPVNSLATVLRSSVLDLATKLDNDILLADDTGAGPPAGAPLNIATAERNAGGTVVITCSSGDPSLYITEGDSIEVRGAASPFDVLNGTHTVTNVTSTTIEFVFGTGVIGVASPGISTQIFSNNYRNIVKTGDDVFTQDLEGLVISIPATSEDLRIIHNTLNRIVNRLKNELNGVIPSGLQSQYITPFIITENANVELAITIPTDLPDYYFVQVYRTRIFTAESIQSLGSGGGIPVEPDDEMRLVFEQFPSPAEIAAGELIFLDNYPEDLVLNNTNLYTNPVTGEGILQANNPPPFAKDINRFKNTVFYANTRTKHRITPFQLLGVSQIAPDSKITIASIAGSDTYTFVQGVQEVTSITATTVALADNGEYFILRSATDDDMFVFWLSINNGGSVPTVPGATRYVKVPLFDTASAVDNATIIKNIINTQVFDFTAVSAGPLVTVTNIEFGKTSNASAGTSPFIISTVTEGNGEDAALKQVLLSSAISAAQAIDETAKSLVRVINRQSTSPIYAYYTSSENTPPGQIFFESKTLDDNPIYIMADNSPTGLSFNPEISPVNTNISVIGTGSPTITVTTSSPHGLINNDTIVISGSDSTPIIDGLHSVTVTSTTTFTIPVSSPVTVAGTSGSWSKTSSVTTSDNETKPNRVYYSKFQQPEAVPLLNYFDVGPEDKNILRIFPLRDSLFVFKEDGLYRISGESAPFVVGLFDSSCVLLAPDSVDAMNNVIYGWTSKGISNVTETGVNEISRPIDTEILRIASSEFSNFKSVTWGVGYDSDNSYTVYTNTMTSDTVATVAFRFSDLTNTWTNIDRSQTCGLVLSDDDKLYMGSLQDELIHQERKSFTRRDYADRDFGITLGAGSLFNDGRLLEFTNVSEIEPGDVITQEQTVSIFAFNSLLLQLDNDPALQNDYLSTLETNRGDNIRVKLLALAAKLDADPGTNFSNYLDLIDDYTSTITMNSSSNPTIVTTSSPHDLITGRQVTILGTQSPASTPSIVGVHGVTVTGANTFSIPVNVNTGGAGGLQVTTVGTSSGFADLLTCFNAIVNNLNADTGVTFSDYPTITDSTLFEAVVLNVDYTAKQVTLNLPLEWVIGAMQVYKAIDCRIVYAPQTFGDPLMSKQVYEATMMFINKAFTTMIASFSSDLKPEFKEIQFFGQGNGIFGHYSEPGFGYGFFGGASNSAPFRTIIPRQTQRCRFVNVGLNHKVAREQWGLLGVTLTANVNQSTRAYR